MFNNLKYLLFATAALFSGASTPLAEAAEPKSPACPERFSWLSNIIPIQGQSDKPLSAFELASLGMDPLHHEVFCRVSGRPEEQSTLAQAVMEGVELARTSDHHSYMSELLTVVLKANPGLRLFPTTSQATGSFDAIFSIEQNALIMTDRISSLLANHELFHAFDNAAAAIFSPQDCSTLVVSHPYTPSEKEAAKKYQQIIDASDKQMSTVEKLLDAISRNTASDQEKEKYNEYLELSKQAASPESPYAIQFAGKYKQTMEQVPKAIIQAFTAHVGKTISEYRFAKLLGRTPERYKFGNLRIISADLASGRLEFEIVNPLAQLCANYRGLNQKIIRDYPALLKHEEWSAHMFQYFPASILKKLFPEFWQYHNQRIAAALKKLNQSKVPAIEDDSGRAEKAIKRAQYELKHCQPSESRNRELAYQQFSNLVQAGKTTSPKKLDSASKKLPANEKDMRNAVSAKYFLNLGYIASSQFVKAVQNFHAMIPQNVILKILPPYQLFVYAYAAIRAAAQTQTTATVNQLIKLSCDQVRASSGYELPNFLREGKTCEKILMTPREQKQLLR